MWQLSLLFHKNTVIIHVEYIKIINRANCFNWLTSQTLVLMGPTIMIITCFLNIVISIFIPLQNLYSPTLPNISCRLRILIHLKSFVFKWYFLLPIYKQYMFGMILKTYKKYLRKKFKESTREVWLKKGYLDRKTKHCSDKFWLVSFLLTSH